MTDSSNEVPAKLRKFTLTLHQDGKVTLVENDECDSCGAINETVSEVTLESGERKYLCDACYARDCMDHEWG